MAGDWIKVQKETPDKPELFSLAARVGATIAEAFLACFRVWAWADTSTPDGFIRGLTSEAIDSVARIPGFGKALIDVGWLREREGVIEFPNFAYHMSASAKRRAVDAVRKLSEREADKTRTKSGPEKRREEKINTEVKKTCSEPGSPASEPVAGEPVLLIPVAAKDRPPWPLMPQKLREYEESFPGVDVLAECRKARQWCIDNPKKRKTESGMASFLSSWLGRCQNGASQVPTERPTRPPATKVDPGLRLMQQAAEALKGKEAKPCPPT